MPRLLPLALLLAALALPLPSSAQWVWRDENNTLVFSDRPPPASVKPSQIVRQPAVQFVQPAASPAPAAAAEEPGGAGRAAAAEAARSSAPKSLADRELEFRKRQQDRQDAERKAAEAEARATQLAQECARARGYLRALEDGVRVMTGDAQGQRALMDDAQRAAETARVRDLIARSC